MKGVASLLACVLLIAGLVAPARSSAAPSLIPCDKHSVQMCEGAGSVTASQSYAGLLYVQSVPAVASAEGAQPDGCQSCTWNVLTICRAPLPDEDNLDCQGGDNVCFRSGEARVVILLTVAGGGPTQVADYCVGGDEQHQVVTQAEFDAAAVAATGKDERPVAPTLTVQPAAGAVTQLPTYVLVEDTPATLHQSFALTVLPSLSQTVDFAPASHTWHWGDGSPDDITTSPGGRYPKGDVTHTYTRRGTVTLTERTSYGASYVVHTPEGTDLPRRTVAGPVLGDPVSAQLAVREGRAELTDG